MHKKLGFLFLIVYLIVESEPSKATIVYVNDGVNTTLNCDVYNYSSLSWIGPCLSHTDRCPTKTLYYDGLIRNPMISSSISLQTSKGQEKGNYNLHISNVTSKNNGSYICSGFKGESIQTKRYELILKVKPSNISIENISFDGSIIGTEGKELELVCSVISGVPKENMSWYRGLSLVKTGGPGNISYCFVPKRDDHGRTFSCAVQNEVLTKPLDKKVTLNIKYRPGVYFYESNPTIIEGSAYVIKCLADGNPTALNTSIVKHEYPELKKSCGKSTCSLHIGGLRHDSGNYTCTAMNDVGEGKWFTTILVLYPPDVKVYLLAKRLQCTARGIPDNSTFLFWKHFSHQRTHLRTFEGSEYFQLSLSLNRYLLNGLYLCEATNGIPDSAGNIVSRGNYSVQFSGKPEILPRTNQMQFGNYNDLTTLKIYVYSIPPLSDIKIIRNESLIEKSRLLTKTYHFIKENIFGKDVLIKGYTISLQIPTAVARDFGNYTFLLFNAKGSQAFTTQLTFNGDDNKKTGEVDEKNFLSGYLIGISVGSALVGVVITSLLCLCIRIMKKKAHSLTIHTQENDTHYDEIGENVESLHQINAINEVGEVGISVSRNSEAIRHETPSDEHLRIELSAAMATEYLEPTTKDDSGDDTSINSSTEVELRQINVYEKNDEYSKSSEESSSQQKRNIYLNVQTELRNSYQCLVK